MSNKFDFHCEAHRAYLHPPRSALSRVSLDVWLLRNMRRLVLIEHSACPVLPWEYNNMHFVTKSPCRPVKLRVRRNSLMKNKWAASGLISSPLLALAKGQLRCDYSEFIEHDLNISSIMNCVFKNGGRGLPIHWH